MGAQFIHENAYSMQLTAGSKKENNNTVTTILAEATMKKGALSPTEIKTSSPEILLKSLKMISNANAEMIFYKQAMKKFQDEYYSKVGIKLGLTRDGPRRMRLSRAENNARKAEANNLANAIIQAKTQAYVYIVFFVVYCKKLQYAIC